MTSPAVVFIAGPFRGADSWQVERNIRRAEELAFAVAETGAMPLCPHTNTRHFNGTLTDDFWLAGTLALLRVSHAVMMLPRWRESVGARAEHAEAERIELPIFYDLIALRQWVQERGHLAPVGRQCACGRPGCEL